MKRLLNGKKKAEELEERLKVLIDEKHKKLIQKYPHWVTAKSKKVNELAYEITENKRAISTLVRENAKQKRREKIKALENKLEELNNRNKAIRSELLSRVASFKEFTYTLTEMNDGTSIIISDDYAPFKEYVNSWKQWDYYSKSYGKPKVWNSYNVKIGLGTLLELDKKGLLNIDGIINVKAKKIKKTRGVTIYKATWLKKQGAYTLKEIDGYILKDDTCSYHIEGDELNTKEALTLFFKKKDKLNKAIRRKATESKKDKELKDIIITLDDSIEAGNCKVGTQSFIDRIGKDKITFKELKDLSQEPKFKDVKTNINLVLRHIRKTNNRDLRVNLSN